MTFADAEAVVQKVAQEMGEKLTLGYVGNLSPAHDDRSWSVWFDGMPRDLGESYPSNTPGLHLGRTADVLAMSEFELRTQLKRRWNYLKTLREEA